MSWQGIPPDSSDEEWDTHIQEEYGRFGRARLLREAAATTDADMDLTGLVQNAFNQYEDLSRIAEGQQVPDQTRADSDQHPNYAEQPDSDDDVGVGPDTPPEEGHVTAAQRMLEESSHTLLYAGSRMSCLSATMILLQACRTHKCTSAFINELLTLLKNAILPEINTIPPSEYAATKMLRKLGLQHQDIDVCPNNCMLYRGRDQDRETCSKPGCRAPRYKRVGVSKVPCKVLRFFPTIPRLQRIYSTPKLAALQTWHVSNRSEDGKMRHAADSRQWAFVDSLDDTFASEHRNVRLGLATDGLNPFSVKRSTWSTWPIILINYNVPPWLSTKKGFIILSMIIPGPESVTGANFDVFLQPLLEELLTLWQPEGVPTTDAARYLDQPSFNLRAVLIWTLHDFPAYGVVSGHITNGYVGCPCCGEHTVSRRSIALRKNIYSCFQYRKWLSQSHALRLDNVNFSGVQEHGSAPNRPSGESTIRHGRARQTFLYNGGTPRHADPARRYGVNRVSSLYQLPYWKVSIATMIATIIVVCRE